ncbi:energy-coupling factor transporter transmembrane protein EcfT [Sporolactobacillus shoreicorticis]|uniref:Energy-coupling factor transporter transmembrane component T n=1 Tax=Sporolactobacillus shoreicorticis TaxID=1923877 RepID=A0ABW5S478_9BACL|nr:energy-coupling factor transporter transmembrane component T [Sporolactobacillus shoreicorticis]MCO7127552.1 energy-coupling factor transporter transmembrane protein EcfT [Sporolactobacillus shoreicorticis]
MSKPLILDPRTKLGVVLVIGFLIFGSTVTQLLLLFSVTALYGFLNGVRRSLPIYVLILLLYFLSDYFASETRNILFVSLAFFSYFIVCFLPALLAGEVLVRTPAGQLMSALTAWHLPKTIIVAFSVSLRFVPIAGMEIRSIHEVMKQRGVAFFSRTGWLHPWRVFECALVPLMIRLLKISDELTASAITRGAEAPIRRTSVHEIKFHFCDYAVILLLLILTFVLLVRR